MTQYIYLASNFWIYIYEKKKALFCYFKLKNNSKVYIYMNDKNPIVIIRINKISLHSFNYCIRRRSSCIFISNLFYEWKRERERISNKTKQKREEKNFESMKASINEDHNNSEISFLIKRFSSLSLFFKSSNAKKWMKTNCECCCCWINENK